MKTSQKKIVLENILLENKGSFMRVSEFRDLVLAQLDEPDCDKAALRRWIYTCFKNMEAKGRIEKRHVANSKKWEYRLTDSNFRAPSPESVPLIKEANGNHDLERSLDTLKCELLERKKESKVFLSELAAYKNMERKHSSLSEYASRKYQETFDKSYELAGVIKALENTLIDHGRSVN